MGYELLAPLVQLLDAQVVLLAVRFGRKARDINGLQMI